MLLLDSGAIAALRKQMEGGNAPPIQPMAQVPITAPQPEAQVPPDQMLPVAAPPIPMDAPVPQKESLWSKISNAGKAELPPEVAGLLTPEQQKRATSGGLLQRIGLQVLGGGMFTPAMQARWKADRILNDQNVLEQAMAAKKMKESRDALTMKYESQLRDPNPQTRYQAMADMTSELAVLGHPDAAKYANILNAIKPKDAPPPKEFAPKWKAVQKEDGTWTTINEETGLDPQGKPVKGITPKDPYYQRPQKQLVQIPKADGTIEYRWLSEGETAIGEKAPPKDIKVINNERSLAYDDAQLSIRGLTDEQGNVKPPPSSWDRVATQSNWTNWAATGEGQAYMNNTRKLIRAWVVLIEGKRMSDADAAVNEAMRSFRPGDKEAVVAGKQMTLKSMAESIGKLGGKKGALLNDPTAKAEAAPAITGADYDRAFKALGSRATDAEVESWLAKNPRKQ